MKDRVKAIRKEVSLTQEKFAQSISLTQNYIAQVEMGRRELSDRAVKDICRIYNVNEEWLRTGIGDPFRKPSEREELAAWLAEINAMPTTSAQKRVARLLTMLDPDDWITIDKMIRLIKEGE